MNKEIVINILSTGSFTFIIFFLISFILVQILKGDLSVKDDFISYYALGKYRSIITLGFLFYSVAQILLSLYYFVSNYYICFVFLLLSGLGMFMVSIFPADKDNKATLTGNLHFIGAIIYYSFILLGITFSLMLNINEIFKYYTIINISFMTNILILLGLFTYNSKLIRFKIKGLIQKIYIIVATFWMIIMNLIIWKIK